MASDAPPSSPFAMQVLPFVSDLYGIEPAAPAAPHATVFGVSWQEQSLELGAIVVEFTTDHISRIRHVARRDVAALGLGVKEDYRVGGHVYIEQLRLGEFITRIDVRHGQALGVVGLRLYTNVGPSRQWLGGVEGGVSSIEASKGFFINALVGMRDAARCTALGAWFCPFSMVAQPPSAARGTYERLRPCGAGLFDGDQRKFDETSDDVRAIVVQCDFHVMRVWVLSALELSQFQAFKDRSPLGQDEFCIELAADEVVERIDIHSHEVVSGLRFRTNLRETPWYGRAAFGSTKSYTVSGSGQTFVGFHGTMGEHYVGSLGVVAANRKSEIVELNVGEIATE